MKFPELHSWNLTASEAIALQNRLAAKVKMEKFLPMCCRTVAGVDVSYQRHGRLFFAGIVVLEIDTWQVIEEADACLDSPIPYIPGLLSFRELPVVLEAFHRLQTIPDAVLVDGQGIAHPRRFGLASHLGLWLELPTVGCAKTRLCGKYEPPGATRGDCSPLIHNGVKIGMVVTTRSNVNPLFISPGHKVDLTAATDLALRCTGRYRLPEPTRLAHHLANRLRCQRR